MGKKLILLGVAVTAIALWGARTPFGGVPSVSADAFSSSMNVSMTACTNALAAPCDLDTNQDVGEVVTTVLDTALPSNLSSFYDAPETQITGVSILGGVPVGAAIGSNTFTIYVDGAACSNLAAPLASTFTIYSGPAAGASPPPLPSLGYAKGLTGGENWAVNFNPNYTQDFDDDNDNNIPDYLEAPTGNTLAESVEDKDPADGVPDGVGKIPLYLPYFDIDPDIASPSSHRGFGVAVIAPGVLEVPVDFVTYDGLPGGGTITQIAIISQGSGVGLTPGNPASSGTVTCPPFTSSITTNGQTAGNVPIQIITGSGGFNFRGSVAEDWDGDGVAAYGDNCDQIPNASQADADGDGIGNACDLTVAAEAADADGDGIANANDGCPYFDSIASPTDTDSDGVVDGCDPNINVPGDGQGYGPSGPAPQTGPAPGAWHDHDWTDLDAFTAGANEGTTPGDAVHTDFRDADDNHVADSADSGDTDGDGVADSADDDPLDPTQPSATRSVICAAAPGGADCDFDPLFPMVYGDGCVDTEEPTKNIGGTPLSGSTPWDFYAVPVPALFAAPTPTTVFRSSQTISAGGAQAIFGYFKKGVLANAGRYYYEVDLNKNGVADGLEYDRKVSGIGPTIAPDGVIGAADAQKHFAEFKVALKCTASTGYRMND